jgi:(E)-4-hydroxy-3-methylbut-2-enyl-diphosphate synthase
MSAASGPSLPDRHHGGRPALRRLRPHPRRPHRAPRARNRLGSLGPRHDTRSPHPDGTTLVAAHRRSRPLVVGRGPGAVPVGGEAPVSVQSMCTTVTADVEATLRQIDELAAGCKIVRVAVASRDEADALPRITAKSPIPVVADIHFQPWYVFQAIEAGCGAVRVNPGNLRRFDDQVKQIAREAADARVPIRIGVTAGVRPAKPISGSPQATAKARSSGAARSSPRFPKHGSSRPSSTRPCA